MLMFLKIGFIFHPHYIINNIIIISLVSIKVKIPGKNTFFLDSAK